MLRNEPAVALLYCASTIFLADANRSGGVSGLGTAGAGVVLKACSIFSANVWGVVSDIIRFMTDSEIDRIENTSMFPPRIFLFWAKTPCSRMIGAKSLSNSEIAAVSFLKSIIPCRSHSSHTTSYSILWVWHHSSKAVVMVVSLGWIMCVSYG